MRVRPLVGVLDYGSGNVHSAVKALVAAGADARLTDDRALLEDAAGVVVPGVGAFDAVAQALRASGGDDVVTARLERGAPVLGICVGMQVLFQRGIERGADSAGLGVLPGVVTELHAPVLPHMGWNTVSAATDSRLFDGIGDRRFYFVHSYGVRRADWDDADSSARPTWATHYEPFLAAIESGPLSATQFHPEKSGDAGITLLANWVEGVRES